MTSKTTFFDLIKKSYNVSLKILKEKRVFFPFVVFACLELVALIILFLSPRRPLNLLFEPPIRTFWGEKFLHYPDNFLLLPRLLWFSRMGLSIIAGSFLSGMAVIMTVNAYDQKHSRLSDVSYAALRKYVPLLLIVFVFTLIYFVLIKTLNANMFRFFISLDKELLSFNPRFWMGLILPLLNFLLTIIMQSAFTYAIPALIIEKGDFLRAMAKSLNMFRKYFLQTLLLVGLPILIYVPVLMLNYNASFLVNRLFPESILLVLFFGIIASSLVIDPVITVSTCVFYLLTKEHK